MPKDNETIHLPFDGPITPSEPPGFAAEQMIRCEECLRANPPTRMSCLYCEAALPRTESSARLRKPTLRQPEKHELGFNCILIPGPKSSAKGQTIEEAANLLKLKREDLQMIIDAELPIPLARTASREEAELVFERLEEFQLATLLISDEELGTPAESVIRPRALQFEKDGLVLHHSGGTSVTEIGWSELFLFVWGRLVTNELQVKERMSRRSENEILDTSQFFTDEAVFDLYSPTQEQTWRIGANSFDFSCLQNQKSFVAGENLKKLGELIISRADNVRVSNSYKDLKTLLELVWPCETQTQSRGWRREAPGKYSLGAATVASNESQFTRYSRLTRYFTIRDLN